MRRSFLSGYQFSELGSIEDEFDLLDLVILDAQEFGETKSARWHRYIAVVKRTCLVSSANLVENTKGFERFDKLDQSKKKRFRAAPFSGKRAFKLQISTSSFVLSFAIFRLSLNPIGCYPRSAFGRGLLAAGFFAGSVDTKSMPRWIHFASAVSVR